MRQESARASDSKIALPADADGMLALAARSMFDSFARSAMGMLVVDRAHRVVWISEGYKRFLPALGHAESDFVGRRVEDVIPNSLMAQVIDSGQPILVDLLANQAGTFLVSRLPLRDDAGEVIGALGLVLLDEPETTMQPLIVKFGRLQRELDAARSALAAQRRPKYTIASFIGASDAAMQARRQARRAAQTDASVLLLGETGTGKELLAQGIHAASARAARPFVGVNIAAVPDTLLEAEFFGVAPGAYTGADRKGRDGKFVLADTGTLFLDEIGDMPLALQAKLLRVLEEHEVEPLGSNRVQRIDVRIIAATSRDLAAMVAAGTFRADLYYRLNVLPIRLPALRERLSDLEALAEALSEDVARRSGLAPKHLGADALEHLAAQPWAGNVRELRNALEQAALMTDDLVLTAGHFELPGATQHARAVVEPVAGARAARNAQAPALPQVDISAAPDAVVAPASPGPVARAVADAPESPNPNEQAQPDADRATVPAHSAQREAAFKPLAQAVAELEARAIRDALAATGGNKLAAARLLGIARATLYEKLAALDPAP